MRSRGESRLAAIPDEEQNVHYARREGQEEDDAPRMEVPAVWMGCLSEEHEAEQMQPLELAPHREEDAEAHGQAKHDRQEKGRG